MSVSVRVRVRVSARVSERERGLSRRLSRGGGRAWMWGIAWARERVSVRERGCSLMHRIRAKATCRLPLLSARCHRCARVLKLSSIRGPSPRAPRYRLHLYYLDTATAAAAANATAATAAPASAAAAAATATVTPSYASLLHRSLCCPNAYMQCERERG